MSRNSQKDFDDDNRLLAVNGQNVTMDDNGNLRNGPLTNDTFCGFDYDVRNRLKSAGGVTNYYDPMDNRTGQTIGTNTITYVVNPNSKLSQVLMRVKNGVNTYYIYGAGLLYEADDAGNTRTYHYDYRGSTVALTADAGYVTDRIEYSAYGITTYRIGSTDTPFLFNGRYGVMTDPNGLLYMRARYYNPYICRFLNPDPIGFAGGLNWYAYADGNPTIKLDPNGNNPIIIIGGVVLGGVFIYTLHEFWTWADHQQELARNEWNSTDPNYYAGPEHTERIRQIATELPGQAQNLASLGGCIEGGVPLPGSGPVITDGADAAASATASAIAIWNQMQQENKTVKPIK